MVHRLLCFFIIAGGCVSAETLCQQSTDGDLYPIKQEFITQKRTITRAKLGVLLRLSPYAVGLGIVIWAVGGLASVGGSQLFIAFIIGLLLDYLVGAFVFSGWAGEFLGKIGATIASYAFWRNLKEPPAEEPRYYQQ